MQTPTSWVLAANHPESEFPLANLPYGVCRIGTCTQVCVAIGSDVLGLQDAVVEPKRGGGFRPPP